ncbi:hypothetical protein [Mumia sp. Pv 4-285]|uniref:hypothetical protein n=1 Tax=Mumia qirimensis TaxID=3234852 RepID=UPI00351D2D95
MFRSKSVQDEVTSTASGEPYDPERTAVTSVTGSTAFGVTWQIDPSAPLPADPEPLEEAEPEEEPTDELADSLGQWLRSRTRGDAEA